MASKRELELRIEKLEEKVGGADGMRAEWFGLFHYPATGLFKDIELIMQHLGVEKREISEKPSYTELVVVRPSVTTSTPTVTTTTKPFKTPKNK